MNEFVKTRRKLRDDYKMSKQTELGGNDVFLCGC